MEFLLLHVHQMSEVYDFANFLRLLGLDHVWPLRELVPCHLHLLLVKESRVYYRLTRISQRRLGYQNVWWLDIWVIDTVLVQHWQELDDLFRISTQLNLVKAILHQILFVDGAPLNQLLQNVEVLLVMKEQIDLCLVQMVDLFVLCEETHDFAPVSWVFLLLNNFEAHELSGYAGSDLQSDGMSTYCHSFNDIIILHELSALVLIILLDGRYWLPYVWCIAPVWVVTELRAPELTGIIFIIKHLLDNNLKVLLRDLVLRCLLAIPTRCSTVLHVHDRMPFRLLHLVSIPWNNAK